MKLLDSFLSGYRWYRKLRGGTWWKVCPRPYPWIVMWVRNPPLYHEHLEGREDYKPGGATGG